MTVTARNCYMSARYPMEAVFNEVTAGSLATIRWP